MSPDERSQASVDLSPTEWLDLLRNGEIEVEGRMPWASNMTLLCTLRAGEVVGRAIYKPLKGERALLDFPPGGLYKREVAAYELSACLELSVVPETIERHDAPLGVGSLQRFIDADFDQHYFTLIEDEGNWEGLRRVAGFDLLANNADRKGGHLLVDVDNHIFGIDNGLCFHEKDKLRTVMWDFAGEELPEEIMKAASWLVAGAPISRSKPAGLEVGDKDETSASKWSREALERLSFLEVLLGQGEMEALVKRAERLLSQGCFPSPSASVRCYPWPLV